MSILLPQDTHSSSQYLKIKLTLLILISNRKFSNTIFNLLTPNNTENVLICTVFTETTNGKYKVGFSKIRIMILEISLKNVQSER